MSSHLYADERIVRWLDKNRYHPRSDRHGKALCDYFLDDLLYCSNMLRKAVGNGELIYKSDYRVGEGSELEWTVDLVIGPPITKPILIPADKRIVEGEPREVWLAVDAKTVMTEHGKARRNRQRDLNSFGGIMKHHYPNSVVGGVVIVNIANRFKSPLRKGITQHKNIYKLVEETAQLFREVPRTPKEGDKGIEAIGVIVVNHTNIPEDKTSLITDPPAPQIGDVVHYQEFLHLMKEALEYRHF